MIIYKVCAASEWRAAQAAGAYTGSADDVRDGFIHFSTAAQLPGTLARFFVGKTGLVLVSVGAEGLPLKWEPARGGDLFPHLYEPLPVRAAQSVVDIPDDEAGRAALVRALA